jgi:hypothetical protein
MIFLGYKEQEYCHSIAVVLIFENDENPDNKQVSK